MEGCKLFAQRNICMYLAMYEGLDFGYYPLRGNIYIDSANKYREQCGSSDAFVGFRDTFGILAYEAINETKGLFLYY